MTNQDARPFVDLQQDAEQFQEKFNADITECINYLDSKITALICDPDSLGNPVKNVQQNALVEFSKAKYDIFISVKSLVSQKEKEWIAYISEMKKLFIENVEIFLAGTKLEIKLPSSEFQPSSGPRKSPGNRKLSSSVASSVIPIFSNIAKSIPGLSSPLQAKDKQRDQTQFNRRSRVPIKLNNVPMTSAAVYENEISDSSESSENEILTGDRETLLQKVQSNRRSRQSTSSIKLANSSRFAQVEVEDIAMDSDEAESRIPEKNVPVSENLQNNTGSKPVHGRRGKQSAQNVRLNNEIKNTELESVEETSVLEESKKLPVRYSRSKPAGNLSNKESKKAVDCGISEIKVRKGKGKTRNKADCFIENQVESVSSVDVGEPVVEIVNSKARRGRSAATKDPVNGISDEIISTQILTKGRRGVKNMTQNQDLDEIISTQIPTKGRRGVKNMTQIQDLGTLKAPKSGIFTPSVDINDDLDVYSAVARPTKTSVRRKTLLPNLEDVSGADIIPGNPTRTKSKRKTIGGISELESVAPSKRLKVGNQKDIYLIQEENADDNLLESGDNYSDWISLKSIDGRIPAHPAIYEIKVWRAKRSAYIGFCDSLRQKLTLYKLRQNSGHKHLDKFVDRNFDDIQIRYEIMSSVDDAKGEVKNRINSFTAQYKTTPAYN